MDDFIRSRTAEMTALCVAAQKDDVRNGEERK